MSATEDRFSPVFTTPAIAAPPRINGSTALLRRVRFWFPLFSVMARLVAVVVLFTHAAVTLDLGDVRDTGIVSIVPLSGHLALALLCLSFGLLIRRYSSVGEDMAPVRRSLSGVLLGAHVAVLAVVLFAITAFQEQAVRHNVAWRHVGVIDQITSTGSIDPKIDAYFNWPGFFGFFATLLRAAGLSDALVVARFAPLVLNLLFLLPLQMLLRCTTSDARTIWLSSWFFLLMNWVNQDYFSPQGMTFFLFLLTCAIILAWFTHPERVAARSGPGQIALPSGNRAPMLAVILLLFGATVSSHQLTPFAVLAVVAALTWSRQSDTPGFVLLFATMLVGWMAFMSMRYLSGHIRELAGDFGRLLDNADEGVVQRITGSSGHLFVVRERLAFTAILWTLAVFSALRMRRAGTFDRAMALIALATFPLLLSQSYGGEMLLRVYLFSLAPVAWMIARLFVDAAGQVSRLATTGVIVTSMLMSGGFMVARYGNDRILQFSRNEVRALDALYGLAPTGSRLISINGILPWRSQGYDAYDYETLRNFADQQASSETGPDLAKVVRFSHSGCSYVILSRADIAYSSMFGTFDPAMLAAFERSLVNDQKFKIVLVNPDTRILGGPSRKGVLCPLQLP